MSDFFDKIQNMDSTDAIFEEIKKLNERLFRINEGSPMYEQLQSMIETCHMRQTELFAGQMEASDKTPDVLDIGEIQSTVYTPDYDEQNVLTTLTNFYSKKTVTKKLTKQPEPAPAPPVQQPVQHTPEPSTEFTIEVPKFGAKK